MSAARHVIRLVDGLLKQLGLKMMFRIGSDPIEDIVRLLGQHGVETIIDGGAYHGTFALAIANAYTEATVHAFEPTPTSYRELVNRVRNKSNIRTHQLALGAQNTVKALFVNASPLTNSLRANALHNERYLSPFVERVGAESVSVVTLNSFCEAEDCSRIDILKLDLQGNEWDALLGLKTLIAKVQVVFLEVQFTVLYEGSALLPDIDVYMRAHGLQLYQLYELVRSPKDGRLLYGDALYVRESLMEKAFTSGASNV